MNPQCKRPARCRGARGAFLGCIVVASLAALLLTRFRVHREVERAKESEIRALRAAIATAQESAGGTNAFDAWKEEAKLAAKTGAAAPASEPLAAWRQMDVVAPADPTTPRWVLNAAGSEPWSQDVLGVAVHGCRPGPDGEIAGYSAAYEAKQEKSRESARRSAIEGLKALALWRITGWKEKEGGLMTEGDYFLSVPGVSAFLEGLFQRDLHLLVRGWYDQKVVIHGEPMYRSAVLVRADDAKLKEILEEAGRSGQIARYARRQEILWTTASVLGLALVIFLLYSLLNAGTKGHFAWPLRILSVGALAALYLGLLYLKGWFP